MKLEISRFYLDYVGNPVQIISQNPNGTFNCDTGNIFMPDGEWVFGGWWLEEMQLPTAENNPFTSTAQYVSILEAIVGNEAVMKIKECLK